MLMQSRQIVKLERLVQLRLWEEFAGCSILALDVNVDPPAGPVKLNPDVAAFASSDVLTVC